MTGHFVRSSMSGETIPVALVIENFSLHVSRGIYEGPVFQGEETESKWKFVVYTNDKDLYGDFLDIRLSRESSQGRDQFVKVKLSIVDCFGSSWLSREAQLCFSGSGETRKVLSVAQCDPLNKVLSDVPCDGALYRLNKKRLLPNDTLTVRGEMVIYEETEAPFRTAKLFEKSLRGTTPDPRKLVRLAAASKKWILVFRNWVIVISLAIYCIAKIVYSFVVVPFIVNILWPLVVYLGKELFFWMKRKYEEKQKRQYRKTKRSNEIYKDIVPFVSNGDAALEKNQNAVYIQTRGFIYEVKPVGKSWQHYSSTNNYRHKNRCLNG